MPDVHIFSTKTIVPALTEQAFDAGIRIESRDLIRTEALVEEHIASAIKKLPAAPIVFTSTNAVEALDKILRQYSNPLNATDVYCMAGRTAEKVREVFPELTVKATGNSAEELAGKIIANGEREIIFFSGNLRRDELPLRLRENGILMHELEIYRTYPVPLKVEGDYQGIVFFSPSAAESFFSVNALDPDTICFAIGATTAQALKNYTNNKIMVADLPRQENLVAMIIEYFKN